MKKLKYSLSAVALCIGLFTVSIHAQNVPPPLPAATNGLPPFEDSTPSWKELGGLVKTVGEQIGSVSKGFTNHEAKIALVGIYHNHDLGAGLGVSTVNDSGLSAGVFLAAINEHGPSQTVTRNGQSVTVRGKGHLEFYDAAASVGWNGKFTVPLINRDIHFYAETGPAFNARDVNGVFLQTAAGGVLQVATIKGGALTVGGGLLHMTREGWVDKPGFIGHLDYVLHF